MRKLILIATAIACKKDAVVEPVKGCSIWKQKQMRTWSRTRPLSQWENHGDPEFYSKDCSDLNDRVPGSSGCQFNGECHEFRYILYKR